MVKPYDELQQQGHLMVEQPLDTGLLKDVTVGVQIAGDGRIWICLDGQALLRFSPLGRYELDKDGRDRL